MIMKVKKVFHYDGVELKIVDREESYMNATEPIIMTRVMAPNGGTIPVQIKHKQTLKSIVLETVTILDVFKARGANVKQILTEKIN